MQISVYQGSAHNYDQNTIDEAITEELDLVADGNSHKEVLSELIQKLNDEEIDDVNNFFTIRETEV